MKDEHVKDAAQDVAEGDAHDVAEDVLATPEDGGVKVLIFPIVIFQRQNVANGFFIVAPSAL